MRWDPLQRVHQGFGTLDRDELGRDPAVPLQGHPLDRREPEHPPGEPGHLPVMAEGRVDEGGRPQIMAKGHENGASAKNVRQESRMAQTKRPMVLERGPVIPA